MRCKLLIALPKNEVCKNYYDLKIRELYKMGSSLAFI